MSFISMDSKVQEGVTTIRKTTLAVVATIVLAVVESSILIFANFHYYAGIVNMYFLNITIPGLCLTLGWKWIVQGRSRLAIWTNLCLMSIAPIIFFSTSLPITYRQGETLISKRLGTVSVKFVSKPVSIPVENGNVRLHIQFYFYDVLINSTKVDTYFTVNPRTGQVQKVNKSSNVS